MQVLFPAFGIEPRLCRGIAGRDGIPLDQRQIVERARAGPTGARGRSPSELRDERRDAGGRRPGGARRYLRRGFAYTETPPAARRQPRRLPVRRQGRLLPAVLGRRWRCCCGWPACRRAWSPASPPGSLDTKTQQSTSCATSTPTRGSRSGTPASAGSPSTRRPPPRPPRSQPNEEGATGGAGRQRRARRASAATAVRPAAAARRAPEEGTLVAADRC